jgi:iron complex transport system ATP-binding protein
VITSQIIEEVYEVNASVGVDADGEIYVLPKRFRSKRH